MWKVRREQVALKILGAVVSAGLGVYWVALGDTRGLILAIPATLLLGAMALRDILVPVRLAPDDTGITVVHGYAGKRHIPWSAIKDIKVDVRTRYGKRTEMLEIDTGDHLHIFSPSELGTSCTEVAAELRRRAS